MPKEPLPWLIRMKLRVAACALGVPAVVIALVVMLSVPALVAWPIVGATVAAVGVGVRQLTLPLKEHRCYTCGASLDGEPASHAGVVCPECGSVNAHKAEHA